MDRNPLSYRPDNRTPEPFAHTTADGRSFGYAALASRASPQPPRSYTNNYPFSGSLRSTRSSGAGYARAAPAPVHGSNGGALRRMGHAFSPEGGARLQPFVPDAAERRTPDHYAHAAEYGAHRASPAGPARRSSAVAGPALGSGPVPSHRVEFSYTNPPMASLGPSPGASPGRSLNPSPSDDADEIADIIADMSKTRISPPDKAVTRVSPPPAPPGRELTLFLQLGDDTRRARLPTADLSHAALVNLFMDKFMSSSLADNPDHLPTIYVRHQKSAVFYELEDMADVVDTSVLRWHTRPLPTSAPADAPADADSDKGDAASSASDSLAALVSALSDAVAKIPGQIKAELSEAVGSIQASTSNAVTLLEARVDKLAAESAAAAKASVAAASGPVAMDVDDAQRPAIARSASMPVAASEAEETLREKLQEAELALGVSRQEHREATARLEADKAALASDLAKLRADSANHPNVLRVRIEEGKLMLKNDYRSLNSRFEDVHAMVQEMRKDVAQRGSLPSHQMMAKSASELKAIEEATQKLVAFISDSRPDWKRTWEEELQNILKEQGFVKDVEQMLGELKDDTRHLADVQEKLDKIVLLKRKERAREDYIPPAATRFIDVVAPDDVPDAKRDFLTQINCVDVDHSRRIDALKAAERLRAQELAAKVNEFEEELGDFVGMRKLRKTGGTEELERRRAEKSLEVMKDMLKSVEEAEIERRKKIAQRKANAKKKQKEKKPPPSSTSEAAEEPEPPAVAE